MASENAQAEDPQWGEWAATDQWIGAGLDRMQWHVTKFDEEYLSAGRTPRNHVWRPIRFCTRDVVVGLVAVRHSLEHNRLEVDVCLMSDVPEFEPGHGARVVGTFLLSEAYKCGGTMEIQFTDRVEGGRVPRTLGALAGMHGIKLGDAKRGRIRPDEAKALYLELVGFSSDLKRRITSLAACGKLAIESACYVVQHGVWTCPELESIVRGSTSPDSILKGSSIQEVRHLYLRDLVQARAAVLGGYLDRKLAQRNPDDMEVVEDSERSLDVGFDPAWYAKTYESPEAIEVPWVFSGDALTPAPVATRLVVLVRARDQNDLARSLLDDLLAARRAAESLRVSESAEIGLLVPRDFEDLPPEMLETARAEALASSVLILVCPLTARALDSEAQQRLLSSRILRQC